MSSIKIINEQIDYDDVTLVKNYNKLKNDFLYKKCLFEKKLKNAHKDYLSAALARLAYEFTKEEYNILSCEIRKRGLAEDC